ncbi:MAG TPA: hypothetical protein VFS15_25725 [Kofleriaceae bacterium]|nr:hypothetical protein [Kofleriaceae bacterium]
MRNLLLATSLALLGTACTDSIGELKDPPVLQVTSPERSFIRDHAGTVLVTGTVAPNADGTPVSKVMVNNVPATINADGSWMATIDVKPGATLIHTEAVDADGGKATDTRSIEAGELRMPGANVENALTTAISTNAFAKIAGAAGSLIQTMDFKPMFAPMNPVMHSGDESGEDCLFARLYIDDFTMQDATITLVPVAGGLSFSAKLDGVDVPGRARYAVACVSGNNTVRVQASSVLIKGTLLVTPDGMNGFATELANPTVQLTGLNISASGLPGTVLDMLPLDSLIQYLAPIAAKMFMGPMVNKALGGLAGPKQLMVLGKTITVEVSPTDVSFDTDGGLVTLDMKMLIQGTENSSGFVFTDNGYPSMDPGNGLQLGLADDLANSALSQLVATGMLNLHMPVQGGTFDGSDIMMTSPPMISADPSSGMMRLVLPDMISTFTQSGAPVGRAAINATVDLKVSPAENGAAIAIELGKPEIHADTLTDIENQTLLTDDDLSRAVELTLDSQLASVASLLSSIPLPALPAGIVMKDMSVSADDGYVMMKGALQ